MKSYLNSIACVALLLVFSMAAPASDHETTADSKGEKKTWKIRWSDGFKLDSPDGDFRLKFGGMIENDWMWASADSEIEAAYGDIYSGNEFRRARLFFSGIVYKTVEFKVQYDFAGGVAAFKDVYIGIRKLPFGTLRIGQFKEPFSLEELTSSKYLTFLERSLPNVFAPSRNTGLAALGYNKSGKITWGFGVFTESDNFGDAKAHGDTYNFSARLTYLPWVEGDNLFHLGVGYHYHGIKEGEALRYRQRPEVHLTHRFVDTQSFTADGANTLGIEAAAVLGRLSIQAEYMYDMVSSADYGDPNLQGGYIYGSCFLTPGDHRRYKKSEGAFDRTKPQNPWMADGGSGAWEVALRYSWLDLTDAQLFGGELMDVTIALNWYLNNVTRMMFNYVYADRDGIGSANFFQMRFQIDF